ncbi:hypothetical protein PV08_11701 [Exophiala spinifera]|uniref:Linalool dehydratase/isomerase domain-containing protein n=1 Tax=Exophiala spinifera TaxID=91928 RepID=A0A0D2ATW4_9EURO|nr:uncharacterized protein PV08_11701 [Exophiala spinifera]KIW09925.1 hypothetical protein PV08_11701 [Exophiala spinifera]
MSSTSKLEKLGAESIVGNFEWKDVLIPEYAGKGTVKRWYQTRTLTQYVLMAGVGLYAFYEAESPKVRAAGLGLVFPGAGLVGVFTLPSMIAFVISSTMIPLALFAWFGAGGVLFPILLWAGTSGLAALLARDTLLDIAGPLWVATCLGGIAYVTYRTQSANSQARIKRSRRNEYLIESVQQSQAAGEVAEPGSRELDLKTLRFLQWFIELGLTAKDDFSYHDIIDQFQTSAIRYQLYETVSDLGVYQFIYAPNFHGYVSQAMRNVIEKSLTERVVGFWKWESLWGKFNAHNWDPIVKDDIMVSGYVLQAVGIYQSNTGDDRYTRAGSLEFQVTKTQRYKYDFRKIADAVYRNFKECSYCLFSCEPNWIYTMCNLVGISGMVLAERLLGVNYASDIKKNFELGLEKEFTNPDGTILTIRSELTGFTIPGLAGALADGVNAILCAAYLPHIAHRNWAFAKRETLRWKEDGTIEMLNLVGADKIDPGNYKAGIGAIRAIFAAAAAEFGDNAIRDEMLRQLDEDYHPVFETASGALKNTGLSTLEQGTALRARLSGFQDWVQMITQGPPENVKQGPILAEAPFPDVLVAKAYSRDGYGLDLVLYPGKDAGFFQLGFERLQPGKAYELAGKSVIASKGGKAVFEVRVEGRTALSLTPQLVN